LAQSWDNRVLKNFVYQGTRAEGRVAELQLPLPKGEGVQQHAPEARDMLAYSPFLNGQNLKNSAKKIKNGNVTANSADASQISTS
jgi:hypothetical protein